MSFWGLDLSPDDVSLELRRSQGLLSADPVWEAQKGRFGYRRKIRYVFFDSGGVVAMAARYRRYVQERGSFVTLAQKCAKNSNVNLLMGAADVWYWDKNPADMATHAYRAHPMTRSENRIWRMRLLDLVSNSKGLVTGSETGHDAMSDFKILLEDRSVQCSTFSNGVQVTVNFGTVPWTLEDGGVLPPGGFILRR